MESESRWPQCVQPLGEVSMYFLVFSTGHWILDLKQNLLHSKFDNTSAEGWSCQSWNFFSVPATSALNQRLRSILRVHTAVSISHSSVAKLGEMGGVAASNEIRRQIDQCTLIPINHGRNRSWIIIRCAGQCHLWEIRRNNFCPQCKGEERKLWRYMIWIIAWPRWGYLGIVVPPCWQRNEFPKWPVFMALRSSNILRRHLAPYITYMNHLKAPFKSFLYISKLLYYFCLDSIHWQDLCCFCFFFPLRLPKECEKNLYSNYIDYDWNSVFHCFV